MIIPYLITLGVMSLLTLILFGMDKAKAADGRARIPELTLLTFTALGGGVGAFFGRILFHHKTTGRKFHFSVVTWGSVILQIALIVLILL